MCNLCAERKLCSQPKIDLGALRCGCGIVEETMVDLGRLARRSKDPGAVDRTEYGRHRCSPRTFVVHHRQRLSKAAVMFDAKAIKKGEPSPSNSRLAMCALLLLWGRR
jgi:hypothetical protein